MGISFSQFAEILQPYLKKGLSVEDFVETLFIAILDEPDDDFDLGVKPDTLKSYYYGNTQINSLAERIATYINADRFEQYINENIGEDAKKAIAKELRQFDPSITLTNVAKKSAAIFRECIQSAAVLPRKRKSKKEDNNFPAGQKKAVAKNANSSISYNSLLLMESRGICHYDGCGKPLMLFSNGKSIEDYEIIKIDSKVSDSFNNHVALCSICAKKYKTTANPTNISRLKEIKRQLIAETKKDAIISDIAIEEGLERVIKKIEVATPRQLVKLAEEPVETKKKIEAKNIMLITIVLGFVTQYYPYVDDLFKQASREGKLRFTTFEQQIRLAYLKLKDDGLQQPEIFDQLVKRLSNSTNEKKWC